MRPTRSSKTAKQKQRSTTLTRSATQDRVVWDAIEGYDLPYHVAAAIECAWMASEDEGGRDRALKRFQSHIRRAVELLGPA